MNELVNIELLEKNTNNFERFSSLVNELDSAYIPQISSLVCITEYINKLFSMAEILLLRYNQLDIGTCVIYINDEQSKTAYISSIGILPKYQHYGFGTELINASLDRVLDKGFIAVELEVFNENMKAYDFYIKNGFIIKETRALSLILRKIL